MGVKDGPEIRRAGEAPREGKKSEERNQDAKGRGFVIGEDALGKRGVAGGRC